MTRTFPKKKSNSRSEIPSAGNQQQRSREQTSVKEINQQKSQKKKSGTRSEIPVMVNQQQRSSGQTPVNLQKLRSQTLADEMVNQQKSRS